MRKFWRRDAPSAGPIPDPNATPDPTPDPVNPDLLAWAQVVDTSGLSEKTAKQAERFLSDYRKMAFMSRRKIAFDLWAAIAAQVRPPPPPSVGPMDAMATVLSVRRKRLGIG